MFVVLSVSLARRGGRVVEGGGLESRCAVFPYRGFESPSLRHEFRVLCYNDTDYTGLVGRGLQKMTANNNGNRPMPESNLSWVAGKL